MSDGANTACFLRLGVLITHLQLPQIPWDTYTAKDSPHSGSSRVAHCPTACLLPRLLRDQFDLSCSRREEGCQPVSLSPLPICMRIQDNELYLNFRTFIRFD